MRTDPVSGPKWRHPAGDLKGRVARFAAVVCCCLLASFPALADTSVAILDFELNDLTLSPETPQELERTASVKPLLEQALERQGGYRLVPVDAAATPVTAATFGYLFDHHDETAALGRQLGAQWIVVGRVHKPSFLFAYLMVHLIDVPTGRLAGDFIVEVKGPQEQITSKGVERLAEKIHQAIHP